MMETAGWQIETDVLVVGSGVAGLSAALRLAQGLDRGVAGRAGRRVLLVTKTGIDAGSTRWAQGGIAAALGSLDSPASHYADTMTAGVGLCDPAAVGVLVTEGPQRVRELAALGAAFDPAKPGAGAAEQSPEGFALTREGGHHLRRIVHAGGDATGAEVQRALVAAVRSHPGITVLEGALVLDLLRDADGATAGVLLHVLGEGSVDGVGAVHARAVVLATGGLGQVFASTTNPSVSTGDGVALALRAGAEVADLEFVQFHPTALFLGHDSTGQQPLVSEALRGEGAVLLDASGVAVMAGVHPLADLAPRDVVAKQMSRVMAAEGTDHLFLDARPLGAALLEERFPTILARCRQAGIDPVTMPIPVAPAAHYASGGVLTDLWGRTGVPGLYACGEVACTGVHGANRLASNSLLEGLVFAARIAEALTGELGGQAQVSQAVPVSAGGDTPLVNGAARGDLQRAMTDGVGVLRSKDSLEAAAKVLAGLPTDGVASPEAWETTGLRTVATALVAAATARQETRGAHWREDFPLADATWRDRIVSRLDDSGAVRTRRQAVPTDTGMGDAGMGDAGMGDTGMGDTGMGDGGKVGGDA